MLMVNQLIGFGVADAGGGNDAFTKLLLHMDGVDASTTFTDSAAGATAHTMTVNGNAQIDTAQSKFGGASGLFDGTGDYINCALATGSDLAWGAGDGAIDFWMRRNGGAGVRVMYGGADDAVGANEITLYLDASHQINFYENSTNHRISSALSDTTWYHVALTRSGTTTRLFLDGVKQGADLSDSRTYAVPSGRPRIGVNWDASSGFPGWIEEFRISVGAARWTADFTPPTAPYV